MMHRNRWIALAAGAFTAVVLSGCDHSPRATTTSAPPKAPAAVPVDRAIPTAPADELPEKHDAIGVTGTWKLKVTEDDGRVIERTVKLTQAGDSLSGIYIRGGKESPIEEPTLDGNEITFRNTTEQGGHTMRFTYRGTVTGDTFQGSMTYDIDGETGSLPFEGKRE